MRGMITVLTLAAGMSVGGVGIASAMPVTKGLSGVVSQTEEVRLVCNRHGRCWRTGPRYHGHRYMPRYGYRGHRYRAYRGYYAGPRYHRPYRHYGPGVNFSFGY